MFRGHSIGFAVLAMGFVACATQATPGTGSPGRPDAGSQGSRADGGSTGGGADGGATGGGECGAVTEGGNCAGDTLSFCDMGMLVTVNCMEEGAPPCQCVEDYCDCGTGEDGTGPDGGTGGGACGSLATQDACEGNVAKWCEDGTVQSFDCATVGATCMCEGTYCDCTG
jgi:hypothetical protein